MKQLLQCRSIRSVCYALIIAIVSTIAPISPFVKPAGAQLMSTYLVGVVDFINESGVQGDLLSRLATDAVVVEMAKTNRYDVSITRSQMKAEMDKMDLRVPLSKINLVRLGESLGADAMLEGSIKSVQLAGSGATRRASVTLVIQMIDQASGEIINGAVQTGTSSARVGYTADDESLIAEAINTAAFLAVKTMVDYIIPEATVLMNVGENQVMLNKGARDGLKPGMRMIVLRQKEIIGYVEVQKVTANNSDAKVTKSMRGIQPEDKVRAIFDMPAVSSGLDSQPLPSGAPSGSKGGSKGALSKIGKFLVGAAVVFGAVSLFSGGRGGEGAPSIGVGPSNVTITWNPKKYNNGQSVLEYQIYRTDMYPAIDQGPVRVINTPGLMDLGRTDLIDLYTATEDTPVSYIELPTNPSNILGVPNSWSVPSGEGFGQQHTYAVKVIYQRIDIIEGIHVPGPYYETPLSNPVRITAIERVLPADMLSPAAGASIAPAMVSSGATLFRWNAKTGANAYYMEVRTASNAMVWKSPVISGVGGTIQLDASQRQALATELAKYTGQTLTWKVNARNTTDTTPYWVEGDTSTFTVLEP